MAKPIEHYVQIFLKKDKLTKEMMDSFYSLGDKLKPSIPGFETYTTYFLEEGSGETCSIAHRMVFLTQEALAAFQKSPEHIGHKELIKEAVIETVVKDL